MSRPPENVFVREPAVRVAILAFCVAGMALAASAQSDSMDRFGGDPDQAGFLWIPSDKDDWTRHFHVGAVVGLNISADFSMSGQFAISGNTAAAGIYSDGYVHPGNNAFGQTSNWGYSSASQYNPTGGSDGLGSLAMHSVSSYTTADRSQEDGGPFPGLDVVYGDNLWYWKHARVGWELGFSFLPVTIKNNFSSPATVVQSTYTFDTGGIVVPQAPYQGGSGGQAPTISDHPVITQTDGSGAVNGSQRLDVDVYAWRLGPSFYWDLNEYFGLSLGGGPAVGLVSGDYNFKETVSSAGVSSVNTGRINSSELIYGGYVNGSFIYHVMENADFFLGAQYMPMGSTTFSGGGRESKLNLGGQVYATLGINWAF